MSVIIKGKDISKNIDGIIKELKGLDKEIAEIARKGLGVAQLNLSKAMGYSQFTQKHGEQLVNEIGLMQVAPKEYKIYAPVSGDREIAYEMYYAEYGAGIGANFALDKQNRPISGYIPKYTRKEGGYWGYYDLEGNLHIVNTSMPVNYMYNARSVMKRAMKKLSTKLQTKIRTAIKRYYR